MLPWRDISSQAGPYNVSGPCAALSHAMEAIDESQFAAAILDINLDGELVFPLADVLSERQIPFLFAAGYGPERINPRFSHIPVIQKPIEAGTLQKFVAKILTKEIGPATESFDGFRRQDGLHGNS